MNAIHQSVSSANRRKIVRLATTIAAVVAMFAVRAHAQNLVTNGSFESPFVDGQFNTYYGVDAASLTGWVVDQNGTSVNHVNGLWYDADGFQSMDLNGIVAGSIYQDIPTIGNQLYRIRFALAGNPEGYEDKHLDVGWGAETITTPTFVQTGHTPTDMGWTYYEFYKIGLEDSTRLTFSSASGAMQGDAGIQTWYGPAIDDVSVTAVPEPTGAVLALALSLLAPIARPRFQRVR